jgi:hypothetical protein
MTSPLELLIVLAVVAGLVLFLSAPLRRVHPASEDLDLDPTRPDVAELEAAREAKYRELRDAELDHRTGKLSDEDYAELDATLRGEAIEILRELDRTSEALPSHAS